jgi:hypothetical protein
MVPQAAEDAECSEAQSDFTQASQASLGSEAADAQVS